MAGGFEVQAVALRGRQNKTSRFASKILPIGRQSNVCTAVLSRSRQSKMASKGLAKRIGSPMESREVHYLRKVGA